MYVVQLANNAWLHPTLGVTTSMRHAMLYASQAAAQAAMAAFTGDRGPLLAASACTPRQRAYYAAAPVALLPADQLLARREALHGRDERGEAQPAAPVAERGPKPPRPPGVTQQVYQWTLDNPTATKADALAAFPHANPGTVGVQFGAARRSAQA
jgi:hypothetical protein